MAGNSTLVELLCMVALGLSATVGRCVEALVGTRLPPAEGMTLQHSGVAAQVILEHFDVLVHVAYLAQFGVLDLPSDVVVAAPLILVVQYETVSYFGDWCHIEALAMALAAKIADGWVLVHCAEWAVAVINVVVAHTYSVVAYYLEWT